MDQANAAINEFLKKDGQHETLVHEKVAPAVTQETIIQKRHEKARTAIEKEIHQDHYHTSIQPIQHKDERPEEHEHNLQDTVVKEFQHGDDDAVQQRLAQEAAKFQDTTNEADPQNTREEEPPVTGQHVHHHFYEIIQPVVQKETIIPTIVHTTIPIREVHRNEAKHYSATALPPITMDEFKKQGGSLNGREERKDRFDGEPQLPSNDTVLSVLPKASQGNQNQTRQPTLQNRVQVSRGSNAGSGEERRR